MATSPTCIVAYTSEDNRLSAVRKAAVDLAKTAEARLILYDIDSASPFTEPLPTWWDGEGAEKLFSDILLPEDLEAAGRHPIALQVKGARDQGVEAFGWLPGSKDPASLAEYAEKQGADLIILPKDMAHPGFFAKLRGETAQKVADKVADKAATNVAVVDDDGSLEFIDSNHPHGGPQPAEG